MTLKNERQTVWDSLREPELDQMVVQLVDPESRWWFSWAKSSNFPAAMYLEVDSKLNFVDRSIQGVALEAFPLSTGKAAVLLGLTNKENLEIFEVFCRRLVSVANSFTDEAQMIRALRAEIDDWHEFLGRARRGMSLNQRIGLFAELNVLKILIERVGPASALQQWVGPLHSSQDFSNHNAVLEVKAVLNGGKAVRISSEHQLSLSSASNLTLVVLNIGEVEDGENLPSICLDIETNYLEGADAEIFEFRRKLLMAGVPEPTQYESDSWSITDIEVFEVKEDFPRISTEGLPEGVSGVKYILNLSGLEPFEINLDEALNAYLGDSSD